MKNVYVTLRNMMLFFFLVVIFGGALRINNGKVLDEIIVALVFGVFMSFIPNILKFLKLPVNPGSMILMGVIVSFVFFFVGLYLFNFINIIGQTIVLGISFLDPIVLPDKTFTLVVLSLVAAIFSIGLELMSQKNK